MDNETVKDFLEYLKKTDTKVLNYEDFLDELKNTHERDFTSTLKTNMLSHKDGLISVDTFLANLFSYEGQGSFLTDSEIKELENDNTNYTYDDEWYTYNDDNYLAHDINMRMFINDDGNYLVFLQVHTGVDAPWGFSSYVSIKFDTKEDYEDAFLYDSTDYVLASCLVETEEGNKLNITVSGRAFGNPVEMYVSDDNAFEEVFDTEIYDDDFDTIKDEVNDCINTDKKLAKKYHIKEVTDYNGTVEVA